MQNSTKMIVGEKIIDITPIKSKPKKKKQICRQYNVSIDKGNIMEIYKNEDAEKIIKDSLKQHDKMLNIGKLLKWSIYTMDKYIELRPEGNDYSKIPFIQYFEKYFMYYSISLGLLQSMIESLKEKEQAEIFSSEELIFLKALKGFRDYTYHFNKISGKYDKHRLLLNYKVEQVLNYTSIIIMKLSKFHNKELDTQREKLISVQKSKLPIDTLKNVNSLIENHEKSKLGVSLKLFYKVKK